MRYVDLHCDTLSLIYDTKTPILKGDSHVTLEKATPFESYIQLAAIWSDAKFSDEECWQRFFRIRSCFEEEVASLQNIAICTTSGAVREAISAKKAAFIYAVEDARLLAGDEKRLDILYDAGVRFLTLTWNGENCIGGARSSPKGLTPFGRAVTERALAIGIIPDLSHASPATCEDVLSIAERLGKPVVCTHSDAYSICPADRNISDAVYKRIADLGGITGICLYPPHLSTGETASVEDVLSHIRHFLSLNPRAVALGCDFDGIEATPRDLPDISALPRLYDALLKDPYTKDMADAVFFGNAYRFLMNHLPEYVKGTEK